MPIQLKLESFRCKHTIGSKGKYTLRYRRPFFSKIYYPNNALDPKTRCAFHNFASSISTIPLFSVTS